MKNKLWAGLLLMLGFAMTDCKKLLMYGSPYADFEVKGKVTDEAGTPIEGIRVSIGREDGDYSYMSAETDAAGEYQMQDKDWHIVGVPLAVTAEDIDGEDNGGEFAARSVVVELKDSDFKGGSDWYMGKAKKSVNFTLEKATIEDTEQDE